MRGEFKVWRGVAARCSRLQLGAALALTVVLAASVHDTAAAKSESKSKSRKSATSVSLVVPPLDPAMLGPPLDPTWPKHLFVVLDSVLLGAKPNLIRSLPDWEVTVAGRPALMISKAVNELRERKGSFGPIAVVALGYNSIWEKDRKNFQRWSDRFDKSVEDMLALLKERGARKIVWVLLRELTPDLVPNGGVAISQYHKYSWYFPYVNERLRAIKKRHPEMALADWATAARRNGVTYDAIHLNPRGAELMIGVVQAAIGIDGGRAESAGPAKSIIMAAQPRHAEQEQPRPEAAQPTSPATIKNSEPQPVGERPRPSDAQANVPIKKPSYRSRRLAMFALTQIDFATVVMLGDSLTERAQWSEITGCPFVANRGIGGDESAGVVRRLDDVTKLKPAAVFLMIGINDILSNVPPETIVDNVQQTIETLTKAGTHVYLTLVLPGTSRVSHKIIPKVDELNAAYRKLAAQPNVSLVDFLNKAQNQEGFLRDELSADGIHLTPKGYRLWRDAIMPLVRRHCQPEPPMDAQGQPGERAPDAATAAIATAHHAPDDRSGAIAAERGGWIIQIGAFPGQEEARERIRAARSLGKTVVANANPFTEKVVRGGQERYRARFAGFSKRAAEAACSYFKRNNIDCFVEKNSKPSK
jgi:lysophospholipase L1-like esterase/cell division septation protein DedD